jgi:2-methylcitrate dehydratase
VSLITEVEQLARFVTATDYIQLSDEAVKQLKIRVLDTLGVAIGALDAVPMRAVRALTESLGGSPASTLIGGAWSAPDRAAFYNVALSRYLDFMDSYLAPGETNHPSDNLGAVLAAAESVGGSGRDFLTALACAYQVHTRLSDVAPVRAKGFDHTTQGAYAVAAGAARALGLGESQTADAIAIAGTANNALRVTRTGELSHWKGLAYPQVAKEGVHAALLARIGITGPREVFEGNKGFKDTIAGPFDIDWAAEDLEAVRRTSRRSTTQRSIPSQRSMLPWTSPAGLNSCPTRSARCGSPRSRWPTTSSAAAKKATNSRSEPRRKRITRCHT